MASKGPLIAGMIVGSLLLAGRAMALPMLSVQSACNGTGFQGSITEGGVTSYFEACGTTGGVHSRIWSGTATITEAWSNADGSNVTYKIGGTQVTLDSTPAQWTQWFVTLSSPEATLATRSYTLLINMGFSRTSLSMLALAQNLTGYEVYIGGPGIDGCSATTCASESTGCAGCCGSGCGGCIGVCTEACAAHDECARHSNMSGCNAKFFAALYSIWDCAFFGEGCCGL